MLLGKQLSNKTVANVTRLIAQSRVVEAEEAGTLPRVAAMIDHRITVHAAAASSALVRLMFIPALLRFSLPFRRVGANELLIDFGAPARTDRQ